MIDACSSSCQDLFLDSANREDLPTQRDLASHRDVVGYGAARQQRDQGGGDDDTRRGPILWDSALRNVNMEIELLEDLGVDVELCCVGAEEVY